jgi:hypothetical protein
MPLKNFPAFYGTRRFITVFTRALHWSLSLVRSILILSTHLRLGLPSDIKMGIKKVMCEDVSWIQMTYDRVQQHLQTQ